MGDSKCADRYDLVCKERFDEHGGKLDTLIDLLRGSNGNPGVLGDMRDLKKWRDKVESNRLRRAAYAGAIGLVLITQVLILLREFL